MLHIDHIFPTLDAVFPVQKDQIPYHSPALRKNQIPNHFPNSQPATNPAIFMDYHVRMYNKKQHDAVPHTHLFHYVTMLIKVQVLYIHA